uniref:N-terminal E2 ubiquitin-conjugating enzyme n=1 Tax=Sinocyclocheilus grahami TaxID=75366 RepID=A0A672T3H1_SINGR
MESRLYKTGLFFDVIHRLQKELLALQNDPPPGMTLNEKSVQNTITQWIVDMEGASGTLYEGEKFQLLFKFSGRYPFDSPQVMFTGDNIPVHPHVYSNGHICLSILTEDWSPALSVQSVCLSIISMLSSCKEKVSVSRNNAVVSLICFDICFVT